jgi:hypothetical protein
MEKDYILKTIADLDRTIAEHEAKTIRLKESVNDLCGMAGIPTKYSVTALQSSTQVFNIRSDLFHGRPLATSVREYLEMRRRADMGPAAIAEIFDALVSGGYEFNTKNDQISRVSLNNTISKNPIFYKLPNKRWGLQEWYPNARKRQPEEQDEADKVAGELALAAEEAAVNQKQK